MTTNSMSSRLWATGLAGLTCVGVAGAIAVRVGPASANEVPEVQEVAVQQQIATYTPEQLATYKQQLDDQAAKLQKYETKLAKLADQLTAAAKGVKGNSRQQVADIAALKPAAAPPIVTPAPAPAPAPQPAPAPDGNSKSSG